MFCNSRRRQYEQLISDYGHVQGGVAMRHRAMEHAHTAWSKAMDRRAAAVGMLRYRAADRADGRTAAIFYAAERRHMRDDCPVPGCSAMARKGRR